MADMPGMEHHSGSPDPMKITFKMRDSVDALYPCSIVDTMYQFSCYQLQGGLILARVCNDFLKATEECDGAPPLGRSQCYVSLGTNASGITVQNTPKAIAYCSHGDPGYQPFCFVGAVKNYIDVTAKPDDGIKFCQAVPTGANRMQSPWRGGRGGCQLLYSTDLPAREAAVMPWPGAMARQGCRRGAELPKKP